MMRFLLPCLALLPLSSFAGHVMGGHLHLAGVGNGEYQITVDLYRDCFGVTLPNQTTVLMVSACDTLTATLPGIAIEEVSQLCADEIINSTCNGGTLLGVERWTYSSTVSLQTCGVWSVSWSGCCRAPGIVNVQVPGSNDFHIAATIDTSVLPFNNGPAFEEPETNYFCLNQPSTYSFAAVVPEGGRISYAFVPAMGDSGIALIYEPGYSYQSPVPGIVLDTISGTASFTPTTTAAYVVAVKATHYDTLNNVIGTTMRDALFIMGPCSNNPPDASSGLITNVVGAALQTGDRSIELCSSTQFCFEFVITDPDPQTTLGLTSNADVVLPGCTLAFAGANPMTGTLCWTTPPNAPGTYPVVINAQDHECLLSAHQFYAFIINVLACPISVGDVEADAMITVHPVPAADRITVAVAEGSGDVKLLLHDGLGRAVPMKWMRHGTAFSADIAALPSALYHLTVLSDHGRSTHAVTVVH